MIVNDQSTREARHIAGTAGLRYSSDDIPGIRRKSRGRQTAFINPQGRLVRDAATLARIRSLAIPPAWTNVWIAPHKNQHLQATGRDARGRKQYRYHPRWREYRDESKYTNILAFAKVLPRIRRRVCSDLRKMGLPREKVLAAIVRLLETSLIRIGNDEYARQNHSFGLTTMQDRHAAVRGATLHFRFRGKRGVIHECDMKSAALARIVRHCQDLPGQELFQYIDERGQVCDVGSADVNDYLREVSGRNVSAKDFRTWAGTAIAAQALQEFEEFDSDARAKRNITRAIERVAARLGNTAAVCRKCYVHPAVLDAYMDRTLLTTLQRRAEGELRSGLTALGPEEAAILALLQERMKRAVRKHDAGTPRTRGRRKILTRRSRRASRLAR
jgi:DNA topoisomerase-1